MFVLKRAQTSVIILNSEHAAVSYYVVCFMKTKIEYKL